MPGRLFQLSISERFSGLSSGKLPRIAKRSGYLAAASSEIFPELGSQPGGCSRHALTPAASMSRMHSSAVYEVTWRCDGLVGGPADQMWTCASTINMLSPLLAKIRGGHATRCRSPSDSISHILAVPEELVSSADEITVELVPAVTNDVRALVGELDQILSAEYTLEQRHGLALDAIFAPNIRFFVARLNSAAMGCGGVAFFADFAEVKRMYVREVVLGRGV